ncbi:MAG TPA: regulatory protein RecX [Povalibacter sp.]
MGDGIEPDEKAVQKAVEATAVRLLARREHSVEELRRKLEGRGYPETAVEAVVTRLQAKRLVSDDRFVSSFVHHHAQRGQGPLRIRAELRQQGIGTEAIDFALDQVEVDWAFQAQAVRLRKFGASLPRTVPERAKQARFLQYRGFSSDQIRSALKSDVESCGSSVTDADAGLDPDPDL